MLVLLIVLSRTFPLALYSSVPKVSLKIERAREVRGVKKIWNKDGDGAIYPLKVRNMCGTHKRIY